jgi:hypothetical protein
MMPHMFWQPIPGYLAIVVLLAFPVVFLGGGLATHKASWRSLTNRTFNMDVLISLGSLPPFFIGLVGFIYPMTSFVEMAATIMTFHLVGRYLETRAKGRASQAIRRLLTLGAKTARVERDGREVEVAVKELQPGDIMVIRPGDKIPTDGEVVDGESHLDESIATGESVPVYESVNGWSQVSRYYSAGCYEGRSAFVQRGADECTEANGIVRGELGEAIALHRIVEWSCYPGLAASQFGGAVGLDFRIAAHLDRVGHNAHAGAGGSVVPVVGKVAIGKI